MSRFFRTHGTTLTIGLFLVSTVSGVFLFFHIASPVFHGMHEWLSMVLIAPVAVHMWRNWPAFTSYFKKKTIIIPLALSLVASMAFAYPALQSSSNGPDPRRAAIELIQNAPLDQLSALTKTPANELQSRLESKGYKVSDLTTPLIDIAENSGKHGGPNLIVDLLNP